MTNESDIKAIDELRAMARVYANHGFNDKAAQLLKLAEAMETRMKRTAEAQAQSDSHVISMNQFRADAEDEASSGEHAN